MNTDIPINHSYACSQAPMAWRSFIGAAGAFGAYMPEALDEAALDGADPSEWVGIILATILATSEHVRERLEPGEATPAGINTSISPRGMMIDFGTGKSFVALTFLADSSLRLEIGIRPHVPDDQRAAAQASCLERERVAQEAVERWFGQRHERTVSAVANIVGRDAHLSQDVLVASEEGFTEDVGVIAELVRDLRKRRAQETAA